MGDTTSSGDKKHKTLWLLLCLCLLYKKWWGRITNKAGHCCDLSLYAPVNFMKKLRKFREEPLSECDRDFGGKWEWGQNMRNLVDVVFFKKCTLECSA